MQEAHTTRLHTEEVLALLYTYKLSGYFLSRKTIEFFVMDEVVKLKCIA